MSWIDVFLISFLVVGSLIGARVGLIRAAFVASGALVGSLVAGQMSDDIGGMFEESLASDTVVTFASYVVIIVISIVVANMLVKVVTSLLSLLTLGISSVIDRLGGLALGAVFSLSVSAALIVGLARLTYDIDVSGFKLEEGSVQEKFIGDAVFQGQHKVYVARKSLESSLYESRFVSIFIDVVDGMPADAIGYIPSDFRIALDTLDSKSAQHLDLNMSH